MLYRKAFEDCACFIYQWGKHGLHHASFQAAEGVSGQMALDGGSRSKRQAVEFLTRYRNMLEMQDHESVPLPSVQVD
jgi:hypothetical protein